MFVNVPRAYKKLFSPAREQLRRQTSGTSVDAVHIGRVYLVIQPRIKLRSASEVSKCNKYGFRLDHRQLLLNVNCGVKIVYDMYVASHH